MHFLFFVFLFNFLSVFPANAQIISPEPLCLVLKNATSDEVLGHVETAEFYDDAGKLSWHKSNFRLRSTEDQTICSTGPFFDGYQLRVVVKTLIPLYSCLTEMNKTITIQRRKNPLGIQELVMDCPPE